MGRDMTDEFPDDPQIPIVDFLVTVRINHSIAKAGKQPPRLVKFHVNAPSAELAIRAIMSDQALALLVDGHFEPVSVSRTGRVRKLLGTCKKCHGYVLEGARHSKSLTQFGSFRGDLLCEDCGSDCLPPSGGMWLGEGLEEE